MIPSIKADIKKQPTERGLFVIHFVQCVAPMGKSKTSNLSKKVSFARRVRRIKCVDILGGILPSIQNTSIELSVNFMNRYGSTVSPIR